MFSPTNSSTPPRKSKSLREICKDLRNNLNEDLVNFALFANTDPITFEDASKEEKWKNAMNQEIDVIQKNKTQELMELSSKKKVLRYFCGTINKAINYKRVKDSSMIGYYDSD